MAEVGVAPSSPAGVAEAPTRTCACCYSPIARRVFAVLVIAGYLGIFLVLYVQTFIRLTSHQPLLGIFCMLLYTIVFLLSADAWLWLNVRGPGTLPKYVRAQNVELFVGGVLREMAEREGADGEAAADGASEAADTAVKRAAAANTEDDDVHMSVNALLRKKYREVGVPGDARDDEIDQVDPTAPSAAYDNDGDKAEDAGKKLAVEKDARAKEADALQQARRTQRLMRRHGLRVYTAGERAQQALQQITLNADFKEETMKELTGATLCRSCSVYGLRHTQHCIACECCVFEFETHSYINGVCVGYANSKYWILLMLYCCLTLGIGTVTTIYVLAKGYNFLISVESEEFNFSYYISFLYGSALAFTAGALFIHHVFFVLPRNESAAENFSRLQYEQSEEARATLRETTGGAQYVPLGGSEAPEAQEEFSWTFWTRAFGDDTQYWKWLLPVVAPLRATEAEEEKATYALLRQTVEKAIRERAHEAGGSGTAPGVVSTDPFSQEVGVSDQREAETAEVIVSEATQSTESAGAAPLPAAAKLSAGVLGTASGPPLIQRVPFFAKRGAAAPPLADALDANNQPAAPRPLAGAETDSRAGRRAGPPTASVMASAPPTAAAALHTHPLHPAPSAPAPVEVKATPAVAATIPRAPLTADGKAPVRKGKKD